MTEWYREDLAFLHDSGFADFALKSAPEILKILKRSATKNGLVVDLGCGSGLWADRLLRAGYRVVGIDISQQMIRLARKRAPGAEFRVASLFDVDIPACVAVTSLGECLCYSFDSGKEGRLVELFKRVHKALTPGGVFVFDITEPGQVRSGSIEQSFKEGKDWLVLVEKQEDTKHRILTRRITTFRRVGEHYRRSDEVHRQRLLDAAWVAGELRRIGFRVRTSRSYGSYALPKARVAFVARKRE